jgi:hypothetical protein
MKPILTFLALVAALVLTGCDTPALLSLDPVATDQDAAFDPTVLGTWGAKQDKDLCILRRNGKSG